MGRGSGTSQDNVAKKPRNYSSDDTAVGGGGAGGGFDKEAAGSCLISFKPKITLAVAGITAGTKFTVLSDGETTGLQLISGGRKIGTYNGSRLEMLKQCIAGGYIYQGIVDSVSQDDVAACTITGMGPT